MITNSLHKKILLELNKLSSKSDKEERLWVQKYLGSDKTTRCISSKVTLSLAKRVLKENNLNTKQFSDLLDSLYSKGTTFEELDIAAKLVGSSKIRLELTPEKLDFWLNFTHGWAENDVLCQSNFTANEILSNWNKWEKILIKFSTDKNVHKKRASIVLLAKAVRDSDDIRPYNLAIKNIDLLKGEKDILITKAVSWILRNLVKHHKNKVAEYLETNKDSLPKIAVREVTNKIIHGVKSKRK